MVSPKSETSALQWATVDIYTFNDALMIGAPNFQIFSLDIYIQPPELASVSTSPLAQSLESYSLVQGAVTVLKPDIQIQARRRSSCDKQP
jgi:hypothetical protein